MLFAFEANTTPTAATPVFFAPPAVPQFGNQAPLLSDPNPSALEQTGAITIPAAAIQSDGTLILPIPGTPTLIAYGQQVFSLTTTPSTPQPGEYKILPDGTATLYPPAGLEFLAGADISYLSLGDRYPKGKIKRANPVVSGSAFYGQWNLSGTISLSRNFKGHPTASGSFWSFKRYRSGIEAGLSKGSVVYLYGVGYFVDSLKIREFSDRNHPRGEIEIQVALKGIHDKRGNSLRSPLDKPINIHKLAGANASITLAQLASAARTGYVGANIELKTANTRQTTLRSEVESRAISVLGFPYYSNPSAVEIRTWGQTATHFLSDADVLSDSIEFDLPGHCAFFEEVQLTDEFDNVVLNLDNSADDGQSGGLIILHEGDPYPDEPPTHIAPKEATPTGPFQDMWNDPTLVNLRDPSMAFESGPTKEWREIAYWNDTVLWEKYQKWGFIFVALDVYSVSFNGNKTTYAYAPPLNLKAYWFVVEETYKTYEYDPTDYNYLKQVVTKGEKKGRFKQETQALESLQARRTLMESLLGGTTETEIARLNKIIAMYQYPATLIQTTSGFVDMRSIEEKRAVSLPVSDTTQYKLEPLRNYYDDIKKPEDGDTDWVEPKFAVATVRSSSNYAIAPDPTSTEDEEKPPLTTGQDFVETSEIQIVYPQKNGKKTPEIYRENQLTANTEGPARSRSLRIGHFREMKGRPGTHTRLDRSNKRPTPKPADDPNQYKWILSSYGSTAGSNDPETGSVNYPDVTDPEQGRRCAECDLSQRNAQSETTTIAVRYNSDYCEGDLLVWRNKVWVIFGIDQTQDIRRVNGAAQVVCASFSLKLGRFLKPPVTMRKVKKTA